jgi:hypothetical protein
MRRLLRWALVTLACIALATPATAGVPTPHRISFQGLARNSSNQPVVSGDVRVRIYDAATAGTLVYDSGSEFNGAVVTGVFNVLLGGGTPLLLDATKQYHLELDVNADEIIGDAAAGRQAFWPAGGDLSRPDLEGRIQALEALVFAECGPGQFDLNGNPADGCEFTLDPSGIYVDPADPGSNDSPGCGRGPSNTDPGCVPCQTIARGLTEAVSTGRTNVYVANGSYAEAITLVNGKNLFGGYASGTWARQLSATLTILRGESASGAHRRAVVGTNIIGPTTVEGFVIFGPNVAATGGNSYGIYLSNCGGLVLRSNLIFGGTGGPGVDGSTGPAGTDGVAGGAGGNAIQSPTSSCSSATMDRAGGSAGVLVCLGTNVGGGSGGGNRCTPVPNSEFSGLDGSTATGVGGGTGGDAGDDGRLDGGLFFVPPNPVNGVNGGNGTTGANGSAGTGAPGGVGSASGGNWAAPLAGVGASGVFGRGGGGGGAGGGADGISPERDLLGGAGGGGGSGACGGTGGGAGGGGGGSFGVFVTSGSAPTITACVFSRGLGGSGGRGGTGGRGGAGGTGGAGGLNSFFGGGVGGKGGDGGSGGHGAGGGGGAGGISCGIFTSGVGAPSYAGSNFFLGGTGGAGGSGGLSLANGGTAGAAGSLTTVTSQ